MYTSVPLTVQGAEWENYTFYPFNRGLGWPQSQSGPFGEDKHILPALGFEAQIVKTTIYNVYAILALPQHKKHKSRNSSHYKDQVKTGLHHLCTILMTHSNNEWSISPHDAFTGSWPINYVHNLFRSSRSTILTCVLLCYLPGGILCKNLQQKQTWIQFVHSMVLSTIKIRTFNAIHRTFIIARTYKLTALYSQCLQLETIEHPRHEYYYT